MLYLLSWMQNCMVLFDLEKNMVTGQIISFINCYKINSLKSWTNNKVLHLNIESYDSY